MRQSPFGDLLAAAAVRHGHTCPSLAYGCRLAFMLLARLPALTPTRLVVRHTSRCLLDGVLEAVDRAGLAARVESRNEPGCCSLEATLPGGLLTVRVRREVRAAVDRLKEGRDLLSFREAGVALLLGLSDDDFAEVSREPLPAEKQPGS